METKSEKIANIPQKLIIDGRPELSCFPLNILFTSINTEGENSYMSYSVYKPDLETFQEDPKTKRLQYFNSENQDWWIEISYSKENGNYCGSKYFGDKLMQQAFGNEWDKFFYHLTIMGVSGALDKQ